MKTLFSLSDEVYVRQTVSKAVGDGDWSRVKKRVITQVRTGLDKTQYMIDGGNGPFDFDDLVDADRARAFCLSILSNTIEFVANRTF